MPDSEIAFWVFVFGHTLLCVTLGMFVERVSQSARD